MYRLSYILLVLGFLFLGLPGTSARTYLVDFNSSKGFRGVDPISPDANGHRWNALPHPVTGSPQLTGLLAADGTPSNLDLGFSTPYGSDSYNGPAGATAEPITAAMIAATDIDTNALGKLGTRESAFDFIATVSHTNVPAGQASPVNDARLALQGLDPQLTYTLRLFGSRKYEGDATTIYEAYSDASFVYLSASTSLAVRSATAGNNHNRSTVATLANLRPSAGGAIYLRIRGASGGTGHLNSMEIIEGTRPVDGRGTLYILLQNPSTARAIVHDPAGGLLSRASLPSSQLRGHWYLMTRTDNSLVWILNRVTGEALHAASDSGAVTTAPWNPDDPRQTWRVTTAAGVSRLRIEGTQATLTVGADGATPTVAPDSPGNNSQDWILPNLARGGAFPWTTYDEDNTASLISSPEIIRSAFSEGPTPLAAEAQKRGIILLNGFGTAVRWTTTAPADALTLRYSVADGTSGNITLNLRRSGSLFATQKIPVTSVQAWVYLDSQGTEHQSAATGRTPAKRFQEARIPLATPLQTGDTLELARESGDVMTWIDLVEAETSETIPLPSASSYLVATNLGVTGNGTSNDTAALKSAIATAASQGKNLYLPAGTYRLEEEIILPPDFILQGAGIWKTALIFSRTAASDYAGQALGGIRGTGSNTVVRDLYLKSAQSARTLGYHAFKGFWGSDSLIENVWADQFETGAWIADYSNDAALFTDGLVMRNCRLRNAFADGVNYANGTRNSVVENCHVRGCGDDALATFAAGRTLNKPTTRNIQFRYNTIECTYRAGGIGIFGGEGHKIHQNIVRDQVAGPGLRVNTVFVYLNGQLEGYPFGSQLTQFYDNTLERTGNLTLYNEESGAIELQAWYTPVENIRFTDIKILTSRYHGIRYSRIGQISSANFANLQFTRIGFNAVPFGTLITSQASGGSSFDSPTSAAGINNQAGAAFTVSGPPPPDPVISSFTPAAAARGTEITLTGNYLSSTSLVEIGAQTATGLTILSDSQLRFTVPPAAVSGRIRVTTPYTFAESSSLLSVVENNQPPVITLGLPNAVSLAEGSGLMLSATATDDGQPSPAQLTASWSLVSGPAGGTATWDDPAEFTTGVTFNLPGNYLLRLTISDGQLSATAEIAVAHGLPATGTGQDVGSVGRTGSSTVSSGIWTIHGSGVDIWDTADGFHFRYAALQGDGFLEVRLLSQGNTDPWAKAGLMIRDELTAGSTHALLVGTVANGLAFQNRPTASALSQHQALGAYSYGTWLRMVRSGSTISAYKSTNGATWTAIGTPVSPAMSGTVYIGLAVTSHNNGLLSTATFDNLRGSGFAAPVSAVLAGSDLTLAAGATGTLTGSAPGSSGTLWQRVSGPGTVNFSSASSLTTTVSATTPGLYRLRLLSTGASPRTFDDLNLTVTSPFSSWQNLHFPANPTGADAQITADPDGDSWNNLLEFAQGGNPNLPSGSGLGLQVSTNASSTNGPTFSFRRRGGSGTGSTETGYTVDGITYTLKASPTLTTPNWQTGSSVIQQVGTPVNNGDGTETVTVRILGTNPASFLKMEVSTP
jgi:hypothetical protein